LVENVAILTLKIIFEDAAIFKIVVFENVTFQLPFKCRIV